MQFSAKILRRISGSNGGSGRILAPLGGGLAAALLLAAACATSPLGRKQLIFIPDSQMSTMGVQAFQQIKDTTPTDTDPSWNQYVHCVADPITVAAKDQTQVSSWEIVVFKSTEVNAFALPGGKIGVYSGLLQVAKTDAQLAAVLGHETGHVIAKHGAERMSEAFAEQGGLTAIGLITPDNPQKNTLMGLLGLGAQVGLALPHSRTQESEADLIGLDLMARAGFDPHQSVELWKNMIASAGGSAPPSWLSTHPASEDRITSLQQNMAPAAQKYDQAVAAGHSPHCARPGG